MKYRPEIDGVRAVAVLSVVLFHAGIPGFAGGYIGVDVFFVISGYLITSLINAEIEKGAFSLATFYERRARRILPALFLVCLICIPFAWQWYLPGEFQSFASSLLAVIAFVSNFYFWLQNDYFAPPSETLPLFHTWSLAVEEQFYILFPLLLLTLNDGGRRRKVICILGITVASLSLATFAGARFPSANFYLLPSRAWELGLGALAALSRNPLSERSRASREFVAALGVAAIAASVGIFDRETFHPGPITLLPVLGTVAVIFAATPQTAVGRLLGTRELVGIGVISYSAYLWHQPLFAFARTNFGTLSPLQSGTAIGVTFVLAWISWRFVEQPFRNKSRLSRTQFVRLAATGALSLTIAGLLGIRMDGNAGGMADDTGLVQSWLLDRSPSYNSCISRVGRPVDMSNSCIHGADRHGRKLAIIGDSQAATIANRLAEVTSDTGWPLIEISRAACPPAVGLEIQSRLGVGCAEFNDAAAQRLAQDDIEIVVILARWSQYLDDQPFDNGEGGSTSYVSRALPTGLSVTGMTEKQRKQEIGRHYSRAVMALLEQGKRVVLVYPVPEVGWSVPREMAKRGRPTSDRGEIVSTAYRVFQSRNAATYAAFDGIPESPRLVRVKPEELFCNSIVRGRCVAELQGRPLYWDDSHLNESLGALLVAKQIRKAMDGAGWLTARRWEVESSRSSTKSEATSTNHSTIDVNRQDR